ncbi:MAG: hypothetical protein ACMUIP_07840 [bacterium]
MFDFSRNWPIYVLVIAMVWFFIYLGYKNNQIDHHHKKKEDGRKL